MERSWYFVSITYFVKSRDNSNNVEIFENNTFFLIFQTCVDGTSVIVSVTVKITSVGYIILRSQAFVHNITMHTI